MSHKWSLTAYDLLILAFFIQHNLKFSSVYMHRRELAKELLELITSEMDIYLTYKSQYLSYSPVIINFKVA